MPYFRCAKQIFGNSRCSGIPEWDKEPNYNNELYGNGTCKLNPETCGRLVRIEEVVDLKVPWLEKPNFVEQIIPLANNEKKINLDSIPGKPKSKKEKLLEQKRMQGGLL